jgi:hypothetical protein
MLWKLLAIILLTIDAIVVNYSIFKNIEIQNEYFKFQAAKYKFKREIIRLIFAYFLIFQVAGEFSIFGNSGMLMITYTILIMKLVYDFLMAISQT